MSFIQRRRVSEILWKDPTSYISQFGTSKKVEISDINDFREGILCRRNFSLFQTVDLLFHLLPLFHEAEDVFFHALSSTIS